MSEAERQRGEPWLRWLLAAGLFAIGVDHFVNPAPFVRIMPPYFPASTHLPLVMFTGVCELAAAVGLMVPKLRRAAAILLVPFFAAVFLANVQHALHPELLGTPAWVAYARLPLQAVLIAWALRYARVPRPRPAA